MVLRSIPSLQRKLVYLAFAFTLVFLLYLLSTSREERLTPLERLDALHLPQLQDNKFNQDIVLPPDVVKLKDKSTEVPVPDLSPQYGIPDKPNDSVSERKQPKTDAPPQAVSSMPPHVPIRRDPYSGPQNEKQKAVVDAFMHAWSAYKKYAWGHDELKPNSHGWQEWMGVGLTIVDSLSTMWIMGLKEEFQLGRNWVAYNLTFERDGEVQLFEIVIRELGGLLSAYHFTNDKAFLDKALDLGMRLYPCFNGPSGIPCSRVNLATGQAAFVDISTAESATIQLEFCALSRATNDSRFETDLGKRLMPCFDGSTAVPCRFINLKHGLTKFQETSLAEIGTLQLEFKDLSRSTNDTQYEQAVAGVSDHIHRLPKLDGLVACFINAHTGQFRATSTVSAGASADSYYEYLLKQWLQTGKTQEWLKDDYLEAVEGIKKHLVRKSEPSKLTFVGALYSMGSKSFRSEMEHLACFLPGTLALGHMSGLDPGGHLDLARDLAFTCYEMYRRMPTGLSPEVVSMNLSPTATEDMYVNYGVQYNLQRPEAIESFFYLFRATGDQKYREWGWEIFQAFEKYTKLKEGYASIDSVKRPDLPGYRDKMETFYLAETLKYLYLLFSDDLNLIPLDKFVINTEAHPLPIYAR